MLDPAVRVTVPSTLLGVIVVAGLVVTIVKAWRGIVKDPASEVAVQSLSVAPLTKLKGLKYG